MWESLWGLQQIADLEDLYCHELKNDFINTFDNSNLRVQNFELKIQHWK